MITCPSPSLDLDSCDKAKASDPYPRVAKSFPALPGPTGGGLASPHLDDVGLPLRPLRVHEPLDIAAPGVQRGLALN
jgi:hypothetical protein